jgi:hypothetical protein
MKLVRKAMNNWNAKRVSRIYKSEKVLSKFNPYHGADGRFTTAENNVTGKGGATGGKGGSTGDAMRANRKEREQEARRKEGKYTHAIFQSQILGPNPSAAEMARKAKDLQRNPDFNKSVEKHGIEEAMFREAKKESTQDVNRMLDRISDIYVNTHPSDRAGEVEEMVDRHRPVGMWGHDLPHRKLLQHLDAIFADSHPRDQDYEIEMILERYDVPQPERTYE